MSQYVEMQCNFNKEPIYELIFDQQRGFITFVRETILDVATCEREIKQPYKDGSMS